MKIQLGTNAGLAIAALLALLLTPAIGEAQEFSDLVWQKDNPLVLRGYGSFFLQGSVKTINPTEASGGFSWYGMPGASGQAMTHQMYVQYLLPQHVGNHYPIVFTHGGILSAKSWQTTPDGRMGWDEYFARQGFDTFLVDQVARARSGFDGTQFNLVRAGQAAPSTQPSIQIITDQTSWNAFRWGATTCTVSPCWATTTPHPHLQFPIKTAGYGNNGANLEALAFLMPDLNTTLADYPAGGLPNDPAASYETPDQLATLSAKFGGAILVGHSESGPFPTVAALQPAAGCYPWRSASACKVKGIIQIEFGCFSNLTSGEIKTLSHIPILLVAGDFLPASTIATCSTEISQIVAAGGDIKLAWLPNLAPGSLYKGSPGPIFGNGHMMMLEKNNLQIADILIGWIKSRGL